jgi:hypothetical protein
MAMRLSVPCSIPSRIQSRRLRIENAFLNFCGHSDKKRILEIHDTENIAKYLTGKLAHADSEFDWVACYEVIERLETSEKQFALLNELMRLAKQGVFVSTVNRRHPIDMQSGLPFINKLKSNKTEKLLDADEINALAEKLPGNPTWELGHIRYAGIKSHYFLMIKK